MTDIFKIYKGNFHNEKQPLSRLFFLTSKLLDVQKSEDMFLSDHEYKIQDPNEPTTKDSDDSSYDFSFLESCNNAQNPSSEWDDCKDQAYNPVQTKVIFFCCCHNSSSPFIKFVILLHSHFSQLIKNCQQFPINKLYDFKNCFIHISQNFQLTKTLSKHWVFACEKSPT